MFICLHTFTGVVCRFYRGHESRQMLSIFFWWKMLNLITNWITNPMDHCILLFYYCSLYFAVMHYNENENRKRATQYAGQLSSRLRSFFITNIDDDKSRVWKTCLMTNYKCGPADQSEKTGQLWLVIKANNIHVSRPKESWLCPFVKYYYSESKLKNPN